MIARSYRLETDNSTKVEIYELRTCQLVVPEIELPASLGTVTALAFTPDGRMLSFGDGTGQIGNIDCQMAVSKQMCTVAQLALCCT